MTAQTNPGNLVKAIGLPLAPIGGLALYAALRLAGFDHAIAGTLGVTFATAVWWMTEAVPIPAASLLPILLFPLVGILTHREAASGLGSHVIMLFLGGMLLAKGMETSRLHERIAISLLRLVGNRSGKPLVFAFMAAGALLSMWISNTATTLILMPMALGIIQQLRNDRDSDVDKLVVPLVLGIAYACSLGGIATLIGTPPNLIFADIYEQMSGAEFGFNRWLALGLPVTLIGVPVAALWLTRSLTSKRGIDLPKSGAWSSAEKRVGLVFSAAIFLWVFRTEPLGGWSTWLGVPKVGDSTVAVGCAILLFALPKGDGSGERLMGWRQAAEIPWGILLLFAGGLTIVAAFQTSGTTQLLGQSLAFVTWLPSWLLLFCLCLAMTFLTELTSNTASTTLLMPIMAAIAIETGLPIELMMIPVVLSASCAFMLPVATAPNAIAYSTGMVTTGQMMREGVVLNFLLALVIASCCYMLLPGT